MRKGKKPEIQISPFGFCPQPQGFQCNTQSWDCALVYSHTIRKLFSLWQSHSLGHSVLVPVLPPSHAQTLVNVDSGNGSAGRVGTPKPWYLLPTYQRHLSISYLNEEAWTP
jgi:hypothetical protein